MLHYYKERARGGAGLLEVSQLFVKPSRGISFPEWEYDSARRFPFQNSAAIVPGLRELSSAVHEHGSKIFMEVAAWTHAYGPVSSVPFENGTLLRELSGEDIRQVHEDFRGAAAHVRDAGFDGIDLHGTHGAMIEHFYSPAMNKRVDEYGGSLENRLRFLVELIETVRSEIGDDMALGMRLCADEKIEGGVDPEYAARMVEVLDGKLDFVNVDSGSSSHYEVMNQNALQTPPLYVERAYGVYMSKRLMGVARRAKIGVAGRITDPIVAEDVIERGFAHYTGMTRALIADPELPRKARDGRLDDIRPCIGTAQDCWGRSVAHEWPMRCTVNPAVGLESSRGTGMLGRAESGKAVLVIGAGVSGLEAARVAAERGHGVVVYEKEAEIGGEVNLAMRLPGRSDIGAITNWYAAQMKRLGVRLEFRKEVTSEAEARYLVDTESPDVVVIATGSVPIRNGRQMVTFAEVRGWEGTNVRTIDEAILDGSVKGKVIVADSTTYIDGPGISEYLANRGCDVTLVTPHLHVSPELSFYNQSVHVIRRLDTAGVRVIPMSWVSQVEGGTVTVVNVPTGKESRMEMDFLVLNTGRESDRKLRGYFSSADEVKEIGDFAVSGGTIRGAINSGYEAGISI